MKRHAFLTASAAFVLMPSAAAAHAGKPVSMFGVSERGPENWRPGF
jgi:hypothetical protein